MSRRLLGGEAVQGKPPQAKQAGTSNRLLDPTCEVRRVSMTVMAHTAPDYDQVVRLKIPKSAYTALIESLGDENHARLSYDGEILEIMSPGSTHEFLANLLSDMLTVLSMEWSVALTNIGSATFQTEFGGFEADKTYYLNAKQRVGDIKKIDLTVDPPPDLLIEIDIANSSSNKLVTYAQLRVPEVWRYRLDGFAALALSDGAYVPTEMSRVIVGLPIAEIAKRLANSSKAEDDILTFRSEWQEWLRANRHLHEAASRSR